MKKLLLLFFLLPSVMSFVAAQNITGKITDKNDIPLPGVNVMLEMLKGEKIINGASTDQAGTFILQYKEKGDYLLTVSCIGYATFTIQLSNTSQSINLGVIKLVEDTVSLEEVVVQTSQRIIKIDRQIIFPQKQQIEASASGYGLLNKLALPGIKVNETLHSIISVGNSGAVQVRINNIVATKEDIISLNPNEVLRIEYIDNPGLRYGENIGIVVNIVIKRQISGLVTGLNFTNAVTTGYGIHKRGRINYIDA